ncbi:MAG: hypothetical protein KZQ75_13460, partial [Candidatus Thiodiazotropha sp. (ex Myrtea spinifera)]|nr:hypothetical protein [Candidatus Thiodiazotropha sp. (ex Myrtea spinifera)]
QKQPQPFGLSLKKRHSVLLVAHLEQPNFSPRALTDAFSGSTGRIGLVLTGPNRTSSILKWGIRLVR